MSVQASLSYGNFEEAEPILFALTKRNINVLPQTWRSCPETVLRIGLDEYVGVEEITEAIEQIDKSSSANNQSD